MNEHEESSHDADSKPCSNEIPEENPEDELETWVDYITRATHIADDLLAANGITSSICWRQARMLAKHRENPLDQACLQLDSSNINQAKKGTVNKEDRPRDAKTSTSTFHQMAAAALQLVARGSVDSADTIMS